MEKSGEEGRSPIKLVVTEERRPISDEEIANMAALTGRSREEIGRFGGLEEFSIVKRAGDDGPIEEIALARTILEGRKPQEA